MDPFESELSLTPTRNVPSTYLFGKAVACSTPIAQSVDDYSLNESLSTVLQQETNADSSGSFFNSDVDTVVESENTITSIINKSCKENNNWNEETCFPTATELIAPESQENFKKTVCGIAMEKNNIHTRSTKCLNVTEVNNNEIDFQNIQSVAVKNEKPTEREPKQSAEQLEESCAAEKECGINANTSGKGGKNMCSDKVLKSSAVSCVIVAKIVGNHNVKTEAGQCKNAILNNPSSSNHNSYDDQTKSKHGSPPKPLTSIKTNNAKENVEKIASEEVNLTVTEDDIYYSRKDEISVTFDTRNDPLLNLKDNSFKKKKSRRRSRGKASKASKLVEFDVSNLKVTLEKEVKPPPAKRVCLDPSPVTTERPLEVFVSNNACENADNNDPQWQMYNKLTNDELRYECVRQKWCNPQIPNFNENLSTYNWRARNGLSPVSYTRNNVRSYLHSSGGGIHDIFAKARSDAKSLYDEKFRAVERIRDQHYDEADEEYHYFSLYGADRYMRSESYRNFRYVYDSIKNDFEDQHEALLYGLEVRVGAINRAEEEATTVSNFYKGLNTRRGASHTRLSSWQLSCWFDREDILNQYEVIYSDETETYNE